MSRLNLPAALLALAMTLASVAADGATIRIKRSAGEDFSASLSLAVAGDTVLVGPGDYRGDFLLPSGVVIQSVAGPDSTILRGTSLATLAIQGVKDGTVIRGFTLSGRPGGEVGVVDAGSSPTIEHCLFRDLFDGIRAEGGEPVIRGNRFTGCRRGIALTAALGGTIEENTLDVNRVGINLSSSSPYIRGNHISHSFEALVAEDYSYPVVGGDLQGANDFTDNVRNLSNRALATIGATRTTNPATLTAKYNYWGSDCLPVKRFFGEWHLKPWTDAAHQRLLSGCTDTTRVSTLR